MVKKSFISPTSFSAKSINTLKTASRPLLPLLPGVSGAIFLSIQLTSVLVTIFINWLMISWIQKLDNNKCECSKDWKKPALEYWAYFTIFSAIAIFAFNLFLYFQRGYVFKNSYFVGIMGIFSFLNIIGTILYIQNLKTIDCKCSEDFRREILYIWNWIRLLFMIFAFIIMILFIFIVSRMTLKN